MEKLPSFDAPETVNGDELLTGGMEKEILDILNFFVRDGNPTIDDLRAYEDRIKRQKVIERMKREGTWCGQDIVFGDNHLIDTYVKTKQESGEISLKQSKTNKNRNSRNNVNHKRSSSSDHSSFNIEMDEDDEPEIDNEENLAKPDFYTCDILSKDALERLSVKAPDVYEKVLKHHFYKIQSIYDEFAPKKHEMTGFSVRMINDDLDYLDKVNKTFRANSSEHSEESVLYERKVAQGIALGNWLQNDGRKFFDVGQMKHTTEYDDFFNHADFYCPLCVFNYKFTIAFDATFNSDEANLLLKLDRNSSTRPNSNPPFGFGFLKYCHVEEDSELGFEEKKCSTNVPLYKIAVSGRELGLGVLNDEFRSVEESGLEAYSYLHNVGNEKVLSRRDMNRMRDVLARNDSCDDQMVQDFREAFDKANTLRDLTTSFFVLSEIHEQNMLILEKDEKNSNGKFKVRERLSSSEKDSIKKIDGAIWASLYKCGRAIAMFNKEDDLLKYGANDLYDVMKVYAGAKDEFDIDTDAPQINHCFGLQALLKDGLRPNKCYINMMKAIDAERNDIVYKEVAQNEDGYVKPVARKFREQLSVESSEKGLSDKDVVRGIFKSISFDSYLENFDELFQAAKETNSVKAFIERLGQDDSKGDKENVGVKYGSIRHIDDNGVVSFEKIKTLGASNHDDIILSLFADENDRRKYFAGKNSDYAAGCLSDDFFKKNENIRSLIDWGVSEGRICHIFSTKFDLSPLESKDRLAKIIHNIN